MIQYYFAISVQRIGEFFKVVDSEIRKFGQILLDGYQTPLYVFLQGYPTPFRRSHIRLGEIGTPAVTWYYQPEIPLFFKHIPIPDTHHRLPWLTAEIKKGEQVLYNLSDFVNSLRWQATDGIHHPTFEEILAAWTLKSGIVLDHNPDFVLECINEEGDTVTHKIMELGMRRPV
jgi:hypothetical protein